MAQSRKSTTRPVSHAESTSSSPFEIAAAYVNSTHIAVSSGGFVRLTFGEREKGVVYRRSAVLMNIDHAKGFAQNLLKTIEEAEQAKSKGSTDGVEEADG
jgi:hypothetical protein